MPDMILQHVDSLLVERIHALARDRQCAVNDVMLLALRHGLGISAARPSSETLCEPEALTEFGGQWEAEEAGVFQEALRALTQTQATQLAPESIRGYASVAGAE